MNHPNFNFRSVIRTAVALLLIPSFAHAGSLDDAIETTVKNNKKQAQSQAKITKLSNETTTLLSEHRAEQDSIASLQQYNAQLQTLIASQQSDMQSTTDQIAQITVVGRELMPLMLRMLESLETFVGLDVPFLLQERRDRVIELKNIMNRADITNAEKFRRLLEAYQIENDYGRTIESYKGDIKDGETVRTVNFLRVGRVSLVYQTLDGENSGAWDQTQRTWVELPSEYGSAVSKGLRIARKQAPPDLIRLPVLSPKEAN